MFSCTRIAWVLALNHVMRPVGWLKRVNISVSLSTSMQALTVPADVQFCTSFEAPCAAFWQGDRGCLGAVC